MAYQDIWVKIFIKHTPNCQFCGEPQNLTIGYLFHEGKFLLRCKHCQAEFKCDFTIGGKVKEWTAEIVYCGKLNQNNFVNGHSDIEKLVLDKTKIAKERLEMKWFYKLKRERRNLIAGIVWIAFFVFGGIMGFLSERYASQLEVGTPLATTVGIIGLIFFTVLIATAIIYTSKACRATKRDEKQQEKEPKNFGE